MRVRAVGLSVLMLITGLLVLATPAMAVTMVPDGTYNLVAQEKYSYLTLIDENAIVNDKFNFVSPAGMKTITTGIVLNVDGSNNTGVKNMTISWYDASNALLDSLMVSDGSGFVSNPAASLVLTLLAGGAYHVIVTGQALASGGFYNLNIAATPLPPALILFGTALAGLGWLGRRRRRASTLALQ